MDGKKWVELVLVVLGFWFVVFAEVNVYLQIGILALFLASWLNFDEDGRTQNKKGSKRKY